MKRVLTIIFALCAAQSCFAEELKVVTTLTSYMAIAKAVGGDRVKVSAVASPRFNPHFIEPKPSDVYKLKNCDLFIHSGLDLEAWRGPLVDAAARSDLREGGERQLDLSKGITLKNVPQGQVSRAEGDIHMYGNPHYWNDPRNGKVIASEIAEKLSALDPEGKGLYAVNLTAFTKTLDEKIAAWTAALAPLKGKEVLGYHDEWVYLMDFAGLSMKEFVEPKPGIPPSPKQLEFLVDYAKKHQIHAMMQASFYPKDAGEYLEKNAGIHPVTICQNPEELPTCSDYVQMVDLSVTELVKALSHE